MKKRKETLELQGSRLQHSPKTTAQAGGRM